MGGGHMGGGGSGFHHGGSGFHHHPGFRSNAFFGGFFPGFYGWGYGYPYDYGYGYPYDYGYGYSNYYYPSYYDYGYANGYGYGQPTYYYSQPTYYATPNYVYPYYGGTTGSVVTGTAPAGTFVQPFATTVTTTAPSGMMLGIDEEAVTDAAGPGMKVVKIYPGSAAERAGLQVGDVIHSANGYLTQVHGNLRWIIDTQSPGGVLNLNIHRASDGRDVPILARLP
jgi:hypothetical protein